MSKYSDGDSGLCPRRLLPIEGEAADFYFHQIFQLFPRSIRIENRRTFKAYDGVNNTFNLAYTILKWKVYRAIVKAKLEPYLGFLYSEQFGKPSLVCDLMEPETWGYISFDVAYGESNLILICRKAWFLAL